MSEFDNWKEEQERIHNDYDAENAWYAGQQSQQAKIDELQGRIDEAMDYIAESGGVNLTSEMALNHILKGNKDEN